jgi:hypothetical protein
MAKPQTSHLALMVKCGTTIEKLVRLELSASAPPLQHKHHPPLPLPFIKNRGTLITLDPFLNVFGMDNSEFVLGVLLLCFLLTNLNLPFNFKAIMDGRWILF